MLDWFANNLMQANPEKFQALAIGKKTFKEQLCFDLNGSKIKCEEHVKLLGKSYTYFLPLQIVFYQTNSCLINL
jgi:hypothetical protein